MNPRTPIEELQLTGSPNLHRALKRQQADENTPPLTPEQESEIAKVDALIGLAMRACRRGQTVRGRRNPAFANLESLVKVRKTLESRKIDPATASNRLLQEATELLAGLGKEN
jgi:hypothetical protein